MAAGSSAHESVHRSRMLPPGCRGSRSEARRRASGRRGTGGARQSHRASCAGADLALARAKKRLCLRRDRGRIAARAVHGFAAPEGSQGVRPDSWRGRRSARLLLHRAPSRAPTESADRWPLNRNCTLNRNAHSMNEIPLTRRLASEAIGSAFLLATVVGSGIMAQRLAGGNVAIALLANTVATGAGLVALILTFGPVSGAHFNPA